MSTTGLTHRQLAGYVALRVDGPDGECPAWIESADRRCGKPATVGLLCKRHHTIALKRLARDINKAAAENAKHRAAREVALPKYRVRLAQVEARINQLDPPMRRDGAIVNMPLHKRMPTDNQISELARLHAEREQLRRRLGEAS